jgi:hypothetical protein
MTEMNKIEDIGKIKTGRFYTREDWPKSDEPSVWLQGGFEQLIGGYRFCF